MKNSSSGEEEEEVGTCCQSYRRACFGQVDIVILRRLNADGITAVPISDDVNKTENISNGHSCVSHVRDSAERIRPTLSILAPPPFRSVWNLLFRLMSLPKKLKIKSNQRTEIEKISQQSRPRVEYFGCLDLKVNRFF